MESAINQSHPDDADDAASFFGAEEEEPLEEDLGPEDTRTDAEKHEDAYQYKTGRGEEVTEAEERRHQEYVADQEFEAAGSPVVNPTDSDDTQAKLRAIAEREAAEKAAEESAPPTPAESAGPTEPVATNGSEGKGGTVEREYIIFQRTSLTKRVLEHLLKQLESGDVAEPRVAYFELHRAVHRNDKGAVAEAYNEHKDRLGEKCDLAAVSSRSFKERHVEPRPVTETTLSIT